MPYNNYNSYTEQEKMNIIVRNPCKIIWMDNPSEELQMMAVKLNRYAVVLVE
jgi:hypothetical protein